VSENSSRLGDQRTLGDFVAFFASKGIACKILSDESHLRVLRLIVSSRCGRGCHYPDGSAVWCHVEGITDRRQRPLKDILAVARWLKERTGIDRAKIAGLEPRFDETFVPFIGGLRSAGFRRISITTHDDELLRHLEAYRDAGLTQISVSIPHSEDAQFARLTYSGTSSGLLCLVRRASELGMQPVKINRVLQRGATGDLPGVIDFVRRTGVTVKLFELMWTRAAGAHLPRFHLPWTDFAHLWMDDVEEVTLHHYPRSYRTRVCFSLRGGGGVEANIMDDKSRADADACHGCEHSGVCAEGYLGCGVRVLPNLSVLPCLLRPELALDVSAAATAPSATLDSDFDELIAGRRMPPTGSAADRRVIPLLSRKEIA
jgi:molybdenum cofactor biosynthesis enzyme MoaA